MFFLECSYCISLSKEGYAADAKATGDAIGLMVDKAYVVRVFEELKVLIQNMESQDAIAVLDKAILDLSKLS